MPPFPLAQSNLQPVLLLFAGAVGLLIAVMTLTRSLFSDDQIDPGRRALAHFLPILVAALVAASLDRPQIALALLFGTSVAALSAVIGFVSMAGPLHGVPERAARVWAFLPAAATLAFIIGFRGQLGFLDAGLLAIQGVLAWTIWKRTDGESPDWPDDLPPTAEPPDADLTQRPPGAPIRLLQAAAALIISALAAFAAVRGASDLASRDLRYASGGVPAILLSVVLALPMISTGVPLATTARAWAPITAQVGVVFLNLCVAAPLVILASGLRQSLLALYTTGAKAAATQPIWHAVIYPRTVWRIDAVVLLSLSLILIPASMGKLRFDRQVGGWLTVGYCLYLLAVLVSNMRA